MNGLSSMMCVGYIYKYLSQNMLDLWFDYHESYITSLSNLSGHKYNVSWLSTVEVLMVIISYLTHRHPAAAAKNARTILLISFLTKTSF